MLSLSKQTQTSGLISKKCYLCQQRVKAEALNYLERDLLKLQTEHSNLTKYLQKLQKGARFPKLRQSIKDAQGDIRENGKKQNKLKQDIQQLKVSIRKIEIKIKELAGPMSVAVRSALRDLGVEQTVRCICGSADHQIDGPVSLQVHFCKTARSIVHHAQCVDTS